MLKHSETVEHHLKALREDFASIEEKPFNYFFCPILHEDAEVPLCMGHVINEAFSNSFRGSVVQRQDVDSFFGAIVEADFTNTVRAKSAPAGVALLDPEMSKKLQQKIIVNEEEWKTYTYRGSSTPQHSKVLFHLGDGAVLRRVVKKSPAEIDALESRTFEMTIGKDCRVAALVSLVKAAHLTLFKLLGYAYALSAPGIEIGRDTLGKFYRLHKGKSAAEVKEVAKAFFQPYANMMRSIVGFSGEPPTGTVEDGQARVCFSPSGKMFGLIVCVRTDRRYHAVLMPGFSEPEGAAAYFDFLRNDCQSLHVGNCQIDAGMQRMLVSEQAKVIQWPKSDVEFNFD